MMRSGAKWFVVAVGAMLAFTAARVQADPIADFYKGKTVSIVVGFSAGGGFDLYARVISGHLGRHIPGNPTVIVENRPGAGSMKAASYVFNAARKDGTVIGSFLPHVGLNALLRRNKKLRPAEFNWIGRIAPHVAYGVAWHTSPVKSIEQAKRQEITVAATSGSSISGTVPNALNSLLGTKFKVVKGYRGSTNMALAMERGETHAAGGVSWEQLLNRKPHWLKEKKISFLWVLLPKRFAGTPDVPSFTEFATDDKSREVLGLLASGAAPGRSYALPPGTPADRVAALRKAFAAMTKVPALLAEVKKRKLTFGPGSGEEVQRIVERIAAVPEAVIARTRQAINLR